MEATLRDPERAHSRARREAEGALIARAKAGDEAAFAVLAERHSTRLRRILYRIMRDCDAAYDAVQETLLRAWQGIQRFEGRSRFFTWLTRIGLNQAYGAMRRSPPTPVADLDAVDEGGPSWGGLPDEIFETREFLAATRVALDELPPPYRAAVELRDLKGLSNEEAAAAVGIGERAFKSRLHRGRMQLRAKLDDYFSEGYV